MRSLEVGLLLGEDADEEVSVFVGLVGGGHQQVLAGRQGEAGDHLPQVDEGLGPRLLGVTEEEPPVQVDVSLAYKLRADTRVKRAR